jgi:hypothetical protein
MVSAIQQPSNLGVIEDNVTYPLEVFKQRAGLSDWAMRMARRKGLKVRMVGRRGYVRGSDWSNYLTQEDTQAA